MRRTPRPRREDGVSLIEVLVATVVLGMSVVAIIGGFGASVRTGVIYRHQAKTETILRSAGEEVVAQGFKPCAGGSLPSYPLVSPVDGHVVEVTGVAYWTGTTPATFAESCAHQTSGIAQVSIRVTAPVSNPAVIQSLDVFTGSP